MGKKKDNESKEITITIVDPYKKKDGTKVGRHIRVIKP